MNTLEQSMLYIENCFSSRYNCPDITSELRTNTKESAEYIITQTKVLLGKFGDDKKQLAFKEIQRIVSPNEKGEVRIPDSYRIKEIIKECSNIIKIITDQENKAKGGEMTVSELNDKYIGKFLLFNGDENGEQIVFVQNIHWSEDNSTLQVDGWMIELCTENHPEGSGVLVYEIEDCDFNDGFWYFRYDEETPKCLDEALQSNPLDTDYPTHVVDTQEVLSEILHDLAWVFIDKNTEIFDTLTKYGKLHSKDKD